jgi:hypothetical protein
MRHKDAASGSENPTKEHRRTPKNTEVEETVKPKATKNTAGAIDEAADAATRKKSELGMQRQTEAASVQSKADQAIAEAALASAELEQQTQQEAAAMVTVQAARAALVDAENTLNTRRLAREKAAVHADLTAEVAATLSSKAAALRTNPAGSTAAVAAPKGKIHRVDPDCGPTLTVSNRDSQSNCWVSWKIMGQPCEFQV